MTVTPTPSTSAKHALVGVMRNAPLTAYWLSSVFASTSFGVKVSVAVFLSLDKLTLVSSRPLAAEPAIIQLLVVFAASINAFFDSSTTVMVFAFVTAPL